MRRYVIIVGGGTGVRMKSKIPKQFLELSGKPLLMHTIEKFYTYSKDMQVILVLPEIYFLDWQQLKEEYKFKIPCLMTTGGKKRFDSVKNGLDAIKEKEGIVAIHDAVRPLVSQDLINSAFQEAEKYGNAIPAIQITESVRRIKDSSNRPVNRERLRLIQTPQTFNLKKIKEAYKQKFHRRFTDDATVYESLGEKIHLIDGNPENIKITTPRDLKIAEALIK